MIHEEETVRVWKNKQLITILRDKLIDRALRPELDKVRNMVLKKDRDWVTVIDGEEGVGKSVLAQHIAKYLDPNFGLDKLVFTADDFIKAIKSPDNKKGTAIVLDEAFNAANARSSMSEVNRSMAGVATEMRQKNLFIIIVLPSFFDLDRYFALWRCKSLFHVYFTNNEDRRYIIFPKTQKKYLYLAGKKTYNYTKPRSPFPPMVFPHVYTVDEDEYRKKKSKAFVKRTVSNQAKKWLQQRNAYIRYCIEEHNLNQPQACAVPTKYGVGSISQQHISEIMKEMTQDMGDG